MMIDSIDRLKLTDLPTPLQDLPRLTKELGLTRLLVKRDDLTSLAMGGNKARKLEYDLAPCMKGDYDTVITIGGVQSNHARMTAAAACKLGIKPRLVLGGPGVRQFQGNLLLEVLLGAEIRYLEDDDENEHLAAVMNEWAAELSAAGHKPFTLPIGGSSGLGALGYVQAMRELSLEIGQDPVQIVVGVGSCGTLAGTLVGTRLFLPKARVIGISVSRTTHSIVERTLELIDEASSILHSTLRMTAADVEAHDEYVQEYGIMTSAGKAAICLSARLEGLLLDPVYTGKVMAGLIDLAGRGVIDRSIPVVFIHTGGSPIVFAYEQELSGDASFTRISRPL
jgi:D-cysteine desulfhydrase family pyridoxal phosphate-dependent enzyme